MHELYDFVILLLLRLRKENEMKIRAYILSVLFLFLGIMSQMLYAQEAISDSERLVRLEEGQKRLENRTNDRRVEIDNSFDILKDDINKRFDKLIFLEKLIFGGLVAILCVMIANWIVMWKLINKLDAKVEKCLILGYREEEIKEIRGRLQALEAKILKAT